MPKRLDPPPETLLRDYQTSDPAVTAIAFESAVYSVQNGMVRLTAAQAAPFLAVGAILPAPASPPPAASQPALELPAEEE